MKRHSGKPIAFVLTRTSGGPPDPMVVIQRSRPFAAVLDSIGQATLLTVRDEVGITNYLLTPDHPRAESVAANLANAVGAESHRVPDLPELDENGHVGWVVARPANFASRDTQSGGDPTEVARLLGREMGPGSWIAATVRRAAKKEVSRTRRWYDFRLAGAATHHSKEGEPLVVNFLAGGQDKESVKALLSATTAALPGFDIEVETRTGWPFNPAIGLGVLSPVLGVGTQLSLHNLPAALMATLLPALAAVGYATHRIPTSHDAALTQRDTLVFRPAPVLLRMPRKPRKESTKTVRSKIDGHVVSEQRQVEARPGDYPLHSTGFIVGSSVIVGIAAPYTGTASGISATATTSAPPALRADIGPYVGDAGSQRVRISAEDMIEGVGIFGLPGRGKSVLVRHLLAFDVLERVRPSGKPGRCGRANTLIVFENKGDGAAEYLRWMGMFGDLVMSVDLADPGTPGIDITALPGTAEQRADFMANMMQYAFGKQAIGDQSMNTLKAVFHAAFLMPADLASSSIEGGFDSHPVAIAHGLLTGFGDEEGQKLAVAFLNWWRKLDEADPLKAQATAAARKLSLLYGRTADGKAVTPAQRRTLTQAPISKTGLLMGANFWWTNARPKATWDQILTEHWAVVINTGHSANSEPVSDDMTAAFSAMLAYSLKDAVQRCCNGWQEARRFVTIYADELALFAGSSPEVVAWLRNQGRAFGIRPVMATQYPAQLLPDVRDAVMSFSTFFWFTQNNATMLAAAVEDLNGGGAEYTVTDIANLAPYQAVLRATVGKQRQPSVPVQITYWGPTEEHPQGRESEFATDQGYFLELLPAAAEVPAVSMVKDSGEQVALDPFAAYEAR